MKQIKLSALRSIVYEVAINGWGVLLETKNDFSLWRLIEYPRMTEYLELERGDRVLDIGSGTSSYPLMLTREAVDVVVVELDADRVRWQREMAEAKAGPGRLFAVVGSAEALPIRDGAFDRVTSISAIEHMTDDVAVGQEISRVLAPGGKAAISVPYTRGERTSFFAGLKPFKQTKRNEFVQEGKGTLVRFYTDQDVEQRFGEGVDCRITKRLFFGRKLLNDMYHESRLTRYWRTFILKDLPLATIVHPLEERLMTDHEPFDIMFQVERVASKILYVVGAYGPRYIANEIHRELIEEFARRGHECIVYAGVTPDELGDEQASYRDGAIRVERRLIDTRGKDKIAAEIGRRVFRYPRFLPLLAGLRRLLTDHPDIDVIHADAVYPIGAIAALAAIGHRAAIVPSIHGGDLIDYPGYGYGRFRLPRVLTRWTFIRSALVRVNSALMAERAVDLGCPPHKLQHILVNIGDRFFDESLPLQQRRERARADVCDRHGIDRNGPLLLGTGRLLPLKGFHDLIAAMGLLVQERPDVRLIIAGPNFVDARHGDQRQALERSIVTHGLQDHVILRDSLHYETEMPAYLAAADLLVAAAHIEGLNRVVAEAGTQGTPAIVSETTGIAPLVTILNAGCVVPACDQGALAGTIESMLEQYKRSYAAANARRLSQRFRSTVIADQLLKVYTTALRSTTEDRTYQRLVS